MGNFAIFAMIIFLFEVRNVARLYIKVGLPPMSPLEELLVRLGLDDLIRLRQYTNNMWLALTVMTICSTGRPM